MSKPCSRPWRRAAVRSGCSTFCLRAGLRPTLADLEGAPHGLDLGPLEPRLPDVLRTPTAGSTSPAADRRRRRAPRAALDRPAPEVVLVGRRHLRSNNSWMHNLVLLVDGPDRCTLLVHPDDAARLGLVDGGRATVTSRVGALVAPVEVSDEVMPGVVSLPHGLGHDVPGARLGVALRPRGASTPTWSPTRRSSTRSRATPSSTASRSPSRPSPRWHPCLRDARGTRAPDFAALGLLDGPDGGARAAARTSSARCTRTASRSTSCAAWCARQLALLPAERRWARQKTPPRPRGPRGWGSLSSRRSGRPRASAPAARRGRARRARPRRRPDARPVPRGRAVGWPGRGVAGVRRGGRVGRGGGRHAGEHRDPQPGDTERLFFAPGGGHEGASPAPGGAARSMYRPHTRENLRERDRRGGARGGAALRRPRDQGRPAISSASPGWARASGGRPGVDRDAARRAGRAGGRAAGAAREDDRRCGDVRGPRARSAAARRARPDRRGRARGR